MRYGRTFRKRLLTFMLSLAMVLTSVNVPALTVRAEEETPVVNEDDAATMLPEENAGDDVTAPSDETGDEDTTAPSDEAGDDETTAPSEDVENQEPSNPSEGDDDSSEGIGDDEPSVPSDEEGGDSVTDPSEEDGEDITPPLDETEEDGENPVGGGINPDTPDDPSEDGSEEEGPKDPDADQAVNNEFEASGTHGATYDEEKKEVTFFANSDDKCYANIEMLWYKEYDSYASAAKAHVSNGGDFIGGVGATNLVENEDQTQKAVTVSVTEGTGAILYYINGGAGHARPDYEHVIVIDPDAEPGEVIPEAPKKPVGLTAKWWDEKDTPNYKKIFISWAGVSADDVSSWEISVDDEVLVEVENKAGVPPYFASNVYAAGEHTVSLVAINSVGRSEAATTTFTLTAEQAGLKEPEVKNNIIVSEQLAQAKAGSAVTLTYVADNEEFKFEDYSLKINGAAVEDLSKVTIQNGSIELASDLFPGAGTYKIEFEKENFNFAPVYQVVYAADTTDNWDVIWNDEFSGTSLDTTKWDYQTGNGSAYGVSGWGNSEAQIYTNSKANTSVADGKLTITGKKEADGSYTSARLRTVKEEIGADGKAATGTPLKIDTYGKVEAKIKMPAGNGIWPAFWMLPHDSEYGTWAASGEIDIMEARGRLPGEVCGTIHYGNVWPNNSSTGKTYNFENGDTIEQYHLYTIEWDPTVMKWYVDGKLYSEVSNWYSVESESGNYPYPAPFDEEFYVLLNLALGGTFDSGTTEIAVDENGVDMDVDYVRWYQRAEGYDGWDITQPETEKDESETAKELLATADENGNFIKDSDFSAMQTEPYTTADSWKIERGYWAPLLIPTNGNGKAEWSKTKNGDKNYLKVAVNSVGSETYSSQMLQYFPVIKGYSYEISYSAYTDEAKQKADIALKIGGDGDNGWAVYSGNYSDKLTTTPTTYTHKFTMTGETDPTARFEFNLATSAGNVYLSDVTVKLIDGVSEDEGEDDDKAPLGDGNHVYNGGFSNGTDGLLYWHWGTADEPEKVSVVRENKERKAEIKATASDPVSMWQYGMNLLQKDDYVLTFDVDSAAAQDIDLAVTNHDGTDGYASGTKSVEAGASKVEWKFTQPEGKTDAGGKLMLTFKGDAKIDNVRLVRTSYNNVDYSKVELYPLYNGDFSNGIDGWNIWSEAGGWQESKVNADGQLEVKAKVEANATFYCVGIKSSSMTLTKGVPYKVKFDYTLPADKTYTLELGGIQREITLQAGTHTYESEVFAGSGSGEFALYLGPVQSELYTLLLDNVVVYADLPEKDGYKRPVSLAQDGKAKAGSPVVVKYEGADMEADWENAEKQYKVNGVEVPTDKITIDKAANKITIDSSLVAEEGVYTFSVKAEGFVATKTINLTVLDASGNLLANGTFSAGKSGWTFYLADWTAGGSFDVNEDGVAVINHVYDGGQDWHFQLYQDLDYAAGDYVVTFDAWSDVERPINVHIQPDGNSPAFANANGSVVLSKEKKSYKLIWKGLDAGTAARFDIVMGSMTYGGVTAPNDGSNPYNIYLDNVIFRPMTEGDENSMPGTIASPGAGKAGTDDVTVSYTEATEQWKNAAKTVYVNGTAVDAEKVTDNKTNLVIDKSVFAAADRYAIYIVAEGFEESNTIFKVMLAGDGNLILGGDMNDKDLWTVYNEDVDNLSSGWIAGGKYVLDYTAGYYNTKLNCWVNWSSYLKKENIPVESGKSYTLIFEAYTDLEGGRDIILEHAKSTAGDQQKNQETIHINQGYGVYALTINADGTYDDYVVNMLLGPIGKNLQIDTANGEGKNEVPHKLLIDNVTMLEAGQTNKIILKAVLAEYADQKDDSAISEAYAKAQAVFDNDAASQAEINDAVTALRTAGGAPVIPEKPTDPAGPGEDDETARKELTELIEQYGNVEQYVSGEHAYTDATYEAYLSALKEAAKCAADEKAGKEKYNAAKAALETAYRSLKNREGLWAMEVPEQYYTGAKITPEIEVWHGYTMLTLKKDYTVAFKNNINAGQAVATVKGKGNFKDKAEITFTILPKALSSEEITVADVYAIMKANGTVTNPKPVVKYGKKTLKNGTDYTVDFSAVDSSKDADGKVTPGIYDITIYARKTDGSDALNYSGSRMIKYHVRSNDTLLMSKAVITLSAKSVDYENRFDEKGEPAVKVTKVKIGRDEITEPADLEKNFDISYENADQSGKATVTVTAKDGTKYYGSKSATYTVEGTKLTAAKYNVTGIEKEYTYTGKPIYVSENADGSAGTLNVSTKDAEPVKLEEGKDYTVSYKTGKVEGAHTNAGTVYVTITGINAYTGTIKKTFKIMPFDLENYSKENAPSALTFQADNTARYTKTGAKPAFTLTFDGHRLLEKTDYTVSYAGNTRVKTGEQSATMTVKGKGNFKGKIPYKYEVVNASAADAEAVAADIVMPAQLSKLKTTVKVVEKETGKALKAGTDYEKVITYFNDSECKTQITEDNFNTLQIDSVVYARIIMKGNYAGTGDTPGELTAQFRLYDNAKKLSNGSKFVVKVQPELNDPAIACDTKGNPIYTAELIEPKVTVTPKGSETALVEGVDYEVSYSNNVNKGKATATVTGIGNGYGGSKSVKFSIVSADMKWADEIMNKISSFFSNLF